MRGKGSVCCLAAVRIALGVCIPVISSASPLDRPGGRLPANAVPIGLLGKIAKATAEHISGARLVPGKPIPYCNLDGEIVAYEFPFCTSVRMFPSDDEIVAEIRLARERSQHACSRAEHAKVWGVGKYWSVTLAATEDRYPLIEVSEGLPRFYTARDAAAERARSKMRGKSILITRIFYSSPLDQLFEFSNGSATLLVDPLTMDARMPGSVKERVREVTRAERERIRTAWAEYRALAR